MKRGLTLFVVILITGTACGPTTTPTRSECWRMYTYDELIARDKVNLDIFWLRDESLQDSANLPEPNVLAREIVLENEKP